jgi:hypothetical protein
MSSNLFSSKGPNLENSPDSSQSTTDHPVPDVEPSVKQPAPVTAVPAVEKQPDVPKNAFKRQLVLIEGINYMQGLCEKEHGHFLYMPHKDMISCYNCGAQWIR